MFVGILESDSHRISWRLILTNLLYLKTKRVYLRDSQIAKATRGIGRKGLRKHIFGLLFSKIVNRNVPHMRYRIAMIQLDFFCTQCRSFHQLMLDQWFETFILILHTNSRFMSEHLTNKQWSMGHDENNKHCFLVIHWLFDDCWRSLYLCHSCFYLLFRTNLSIINSNRVSCGNTE